MWLLLKVKPFSITLICYSHLFNTSFILICYSSFILISLFSFVILLICYSSHLSLFSSVIILIYYSHLSVVPFVIILICHYSHLSLFSFVIIFICHYSHFIILISLLSFHNSHLLFSFVIIFICHYFHLLFSSYIPVDKQLVKSLGHDYAGSATFELIDILGTAIGDTVAMSKKVRLLLTVTTGKTCNISKPKYHKDHGRHSASWTSFSRPNALCNNTKNKR